MIITKLFEIRDRMTFIPVIAVKPVALPYLTQDISAEQYLLGRAGYGQHDQGLVLLGRLDEPKLRYGAAEWDDRTFQVAHDFIELNWDCLNSGDIVDVEYILGESSEPKPSERLAREPATQKQEEETPF